MMQQHQTQNQMETQRPCKLSSRSSSRIARRSTHQSILILIQLLALKLITANAICTPLYSNTWAGLKEAVVESFGFAILCPFEISGNNCKTDGGDDEEASYVIQSSVTIYCDPFASLGSESNCKIDCPGRHFAVKSGAELTLNGIFLEGATESSVMAEANSRVTIFNSFFVGNEKRVGHGGAVWADAESNVNIEFSEFRNNQAVEGGAVYNLGNMLVLQSTFMDNTAGGGGALFCGGSSSTELTRNVMFNNRARYGPSVFDRFNVGVRLSGNTACGNQFSNGRITCDGVQARVSRFRFACTQFEEICTAPTQMPTGAPTFQPTVTRTESPTQRPSLRPSSGPTLTPTTPPTDVPSYTPTTSNPSAAPSSPSPSFQPTYQPTLRPSSEPTPFDLTSRLEPELPPSSSPSDIMEGNNTIVPSTNPSSIPSDAPSLVPSLLPTDTTPSSIPSDAPSLVPSAIPSDMPSMVPSVLPSSIPSDSPSVVPSQIPTE